MRFLFPPVLLAAALLSGSCRDAKVAAYRVAAEKPEPLPPVLTGGAGAGSAASTSASAGRDAMASTAVPTADGPALTWTAPEHWKAKPVSPMRKGSFTIPGENGVDADLSITAFPGNVGGELANFNRWRNQVGLPPLSQEEMEPLVARLEQNGLNFAVLEIINRAADNPQRIVGAQVPYEGATWFVKLVGPEQLVAREKPSFFAFLRTVKPAHQ